MGEIHKRSEKYQISEKINHLALVSNIETKYDMLNCHCQYTGTVNLKGQPNGIGQFVTDTGQIIEGQFQNSKGHTKTGSRLHKDN